MADKQTIDVSEFEKRRDQVHQDENGAQWNLAKSFEHTTVYRRADNDSVFKFVRNMVGIPKEDCVKLTLDYKLRSRFDTQFPEIKLIENTGEYDIVYWYSPLPFPCSHRDIVNAIKKFEDEATNTTTAIAISTTHPDAPEKPKIVRAEIIQSGMIFRPDEKDPNSSVFTIVSHIDMKGMLPTFVVNSAILGNADKFRVEMTKFYNEVYLKEKQENAS